MSGRPADSRARVLTLLEQHGRDTTSFLTLDEGFRYWFDGEHACVAYVDTGGAWVAAGGPIAPPGREAGTMASFVAAARRAGRRARFFGVEHELASDARFAVLSIGEQPSWDPSRWAERLATKQSLREQLRRARAKGVRVRLVSPSEVEHPCAPLRVAVDRLVARWLHSRAMAPMGFVVRVAPFEWVGRRRLLVAEVGRRVIGFLAAAPIYARDGWFLQHVLRDPHAPNGTVELMFDHAMRSLADEGSRHVSFGLAPLAGTRSPLLRVVRRLSGPLYDFDGLARFKRKLLPDRWQQVYLAFPAGERGVSATIDALSAFAGGSFVRFGWRTAKHRAQLVAALLAIVIVPWTALLAAADTERWFPSATVQSGWLVLDVLLVTGLLALACRWRPTLARLVAGLVALDFALGAAQLAAWNAPRLTGAFEHFLASLAVLAPAAAAVFLWTSARSQAEATAPNEVSA